MAVIKKFRIKSFKEQETLLQLDNISMFYDKRRILNAIPAGLPFTPLMTVYLTDDLSSDVLRKGSEDGVFVGAKLYPASLAFCI